MLTADARSTCFFLFGDLPSLLRFNLKDGTALMAFTHRFLAEAVVIKDPYSHSYADGGGTIVQRFGAPASFVGTETKYHSFGQ